MEIIMNKLLTAFWAVFLCLGTPLMAQDTCLKVPLTLALTRLQKAGQLSPIVQGDIDMKATETQIFTLVNNLQNDDWVILVSPDKNTTCVFLAGHHLRPFRSTEPE
jgi:hypothetical protein